MICTDYPLGALLILLDRDCLPERYASLVPYRDTLLAGLQKCGCRTKHDAETLPDDEILEIGLPDLAAVRLFRRFLALYDPAPQKFREIDALVSDPAERAAYRELYHLPGVKQTRASLYYRAGYRTLRDLADDTVENVRERTANVIAEEKPSCIVPLPKEVRTHIAVARAFTESDDEKRRFPD